MERMGMEGREAQTLGQRMSVQDMERMRQEGLGTGRYGVTLSLLHLVLLVQLVVVLLGHPRLSQPSVPSGIVAGYKDRFHRISERAPIVTSDLCSF